MNFVFAPSAIISVPVIGQPEQFPVHRIYCVGRNYEEHAKEMGYTGREPPFFFLKPTDALVVVPEGQTGQIPYPSMTGNFHHEIELVVAIGKGGKNISKTDAPKHIFGYTVFNDFSARDKQIREMEGRMGPTKGKSFDTGNAMGPWIVTADEIPNSRDLKVQVRVNGEAWGNSSTSSMIHSFEDMIAYISECETLHVGEFFGSGTMAGCCSLECDRWMKDGDVVEVEFERIGVLRNPVKRLKK
jgi:fumarylpyruvate hydrolase